MLVLCIAGILLHGNYTRVSLPPFVGWFSTLPLLLLVVHPRLQGRGNTLFALAMMHGFWMLGVDCVSTLGFLPWFIVVLFYWPLAVPWLVLPRCILRRWPRTPLALLWAVTYTGVDWFRIRLGPGEISIPNLAYPQADRTKLIQIAELAGSGAVTFVLASVTGLLAAAILVRYTHPERALRAWLVQAACVAVLVGGVISFGAWRDTEAGFSDGPRLQVLQSMTARRGRTESGHRLTYELQVLLTLSSAREDVDLVVWPENSITAELHQEGVGWDPYYSEDLRWVSEQLDAPVLLSSLSVLENEREAHGTAVLWEAGQEPQVYNKVRMMPWTEYLPAKAFFSWLGESALEGWEDFVKSNIGWIPTGKVAALDTLRPLVFTARSGREYSFGTPLCFELSTSRVVNRWHQLGADFLINQTSEGMLLDSIHRETLQISQFRAVEGRVSVVRAGNDGISALVDPNGRVRELLRGRLTGSTINEPGVFYPTVIMDDRRGTFYAKWGDWLPIACLALAVILSVLGMVLGPPTSKLTEPRHFEPRDVATT